ncbi:ATP-binding protein [Gracilibacillus caseinilyticus]|uniref:ATP-binding protein n=1 Tax=Gracilibacillus caseinilyticus TaxID=2932256 RepID=A0ABY4ES76_9BACI|nr:AAA family ATPase [Gracilibacillus caseinilyticus]UOQ47205.1 ATP-binding protein [Gracilibacillus caseinilyticus]
MIYKLQINELNGEKDNNKNIRFYNDLTILVGDNGSGKTTCLDILNSILTNSYLKLFNHEFSSIILDTSNEVISISKTNAEILNVKISTSNDVFEFKVMNNRDESESPEPFVNFNSIYFPTFRRIETDFLELSNSLYRNSINQLHRHEEYVGKRYIEDLSIRLSEQNRIILGLTNKDINKLISKKWNEVIEFEKTKLNQLIKDFFLSLVDISMIDNGFPLTNNIEIDEINNGLENLFVTAGYIERDDISSLNMIKEYTNSIEWSKKTLETPNSNDNITEALKVMISYEKVEKLIQMYNEAHKEISKKKAQFDNLKMTLSKFLNKKVELEDGNLIFIKKGRILKYEDLSAGEKQLVALFVYTKLSADNESIVIIDEPELSLHIKWQRELIEALMDGENDKQFIISTHSPFIISNSHKHIYELGEVGEYSYEF